LRARHALVSGLADLATGSAKRNERKMRLESYVLAARLEQIAAAATTRLARMSQGRYTLVHSDDRAARGKLSGLGLHVVDAWTGRERDTASLSGGETFYVSLALALGLADVVTDEAAGCGSTRSSSTRASGASTSRLSTRSWTSSTDCASASAASAS
ncbi:exonuclease SbcC, partial [Streptomyces sp. SolWspMP-sol7th]